MTTLTELKDQLQLRIAQMEQCPQLLEQLLKLTELLLEAYSRSSNARLTLHLGEGLIRKQEITQWEQWNKNA